MLNTNARLHNCITTLQNSFSKWNPMMASVRPKHVVSNFFISRFLIITSIRKLTVVLLTVSPYQHLLAIVACTTKNETKVLENHKSRNLKSYYCSCINGRQRQATYYWMQGNYEWLELQCQLHTYTVSCSGLNKCKCFTPFCTAHQLRHILFYHHRKNIYNPFQ